MAADLAVIVTARNEASRLGPTLRALHATFPAAELWVADDGSQDATAEVARGEGARVVEARERRGKGGAATLAAEAVLREGEPALLLADADLGESAAALRRLVEAISGGADAGGAADSSGAADPRGGDLAIATFARRVGGGLGIAVGTSRWAIRRATGRTMEAPLSGQRAM